MRLYMSPAVVPVRPASAARIIRPAVFLILQTSPGNYRAWVAVEGSDKDFASRLKRGIGADKYVSGPF